ncbi:hypothetical protein AGMMS4952_05270 [Spirochaetia bacterium]|nr:hypothetical protein AGMMS4952_05270 [Spirochaetia bacterium]
MNKAFKIISTIICLSGLVLSTGITVYQNITTNKNVFGQWLAPVYINMEINREYANNVSTYSESATKQYYPMTTRPVNTENNRIQNIEIHTQLNTTAFHRKIYLCIPQVLLQETVNAIDNISIFIGNKLCYYSNTDIQKFEIKTTDEYSFLFIPNLYYSKSLLVKNWANYYGDLNLVLKLLFNFLLYPYRFIVSYLFLLGILIINRKNFQSVYFWLLQKPNLWQNVGLIMVITLGFILRINDYVRFSGWSDEIYSAVSSGNPTLPFMTTCTDPGNPPFYVILLRYWFKIFGWSEESGTMLSVVLGTLAIPAIYILIKQNYGAKTALMTSFFMAISGFAIGYSQEMRGYILKIFLTPVAAFLFFKFLRKQSVLNLFLYILPSICIANTHYYGILFIMGNFLFYLFFERGSDSFTWKKTGIFLAGNIIIALSFMPYFLYQLFVEQYNFEREWVIRPEHAAIMTILICIAGCVTAYSRKINLNRIWKNTQKVFTLYVVSVPILIFTLAFLISFVKPMLNIRYLLPVSFPFFLSFSAILISGCKRTRKTKYICVMLVWAASVALYEGKAGIPGDGYASYRQARAFIASDAVAHPDKKSAMLDNAPKNAQYYGFAAIPQYSPESGYDVLYVFNNIFGMNEEDQYKQLYAHNFNDENMLVIIPNDEVVIFKKYLP